MANERHRVYISTPNHMIFLRGRAVRTPVEFKDLTKEELDLVKLQIKRHDLKFSINSENEEEVETIEVVEVTEEEVFVEDLYTVKEETESKSVLDKLIEESK